MMEHPRQFMGGRERHGCPIGAVGSVPGTNHSRWKKREVEMIESMYKVEHRGFYEEEVGPGNRKTWGYKPDGAVYENFSGTYIANFSQVAAYEHHVNLYFEGGGSVKMKTQRDLSLLCREIWRKYWNTLSFREKVKRILFAHRTWIASILAGMVGSIITLGVSSGI